MKPKNEAARGALDRVALMLLKLERGAQHEAKLISYNMRNASAAFDDARLAEIERLYHWIAAQPATNARRLRNSPEGIDRLIRAIRDMQEDLTRDTGHPWGFRQCDHLHHCMGLEMHAVPLSRARRLSDAIGGNFENLEDDDRPELPTRERREWAAGEILTLMSEEVAKLKRLREGLDLASLELDRSEAPYRAMFDASKEAVLARKYDAANERSLYRAMKEFRAFQAEAEIPPQVASEPAAELGSSLPEPSEAEVEDSDVDPTGPGFAEPAVPGPSNPGKPPRKARRAPIPSRRNR